MEVETNRAIEHVWQDLLSAIRVDCGDDMTDIDAWIAWKLGLAAFRESRNYRAKWPHDPQ